MYSDVASLLSHTDSEKLKMKQSSSYLRVEKRNYQNKRPVLIVGPFSEAIGDKLASDYPATFGHCEPEYLNSDLATVEQGIVDNVFVDFKRRGPHFECTTLRSVRDLMSQGKHCLLDIHMSAVDKLHQVQIYPIVLLVKYKTVKQLREVRDPRYLPESLSQKDARHLQETTGRLEADFRHLISEVVPAGSNLMLVCAQVAAKIELQQGKAVWVPSGGAAVW